MSVDASYPQVAVVILAAGLGTRMKSDKAKVLHEVLDRPMISYVVETAVAVAGEQVVVVVGHQAERVRAVAGAEARVRFALQREQLGTGHAVMCALPQLRPESEHVVILCGDVPLLTATTVKKLVADHLAHRRHLTVLAVELNNPGGYGRILIDGRRNLRGIVEEADADERQKAIRLINSGIYCVERNFLADALERIDGDNAQGELYLTDIVGVGYRQKRRLGIVVGDDVDEIVGVNSVDDLRAAESLMRKRCD